jgi:hypothetical protein
MEPSFENRSKPLKLPSPTKTMRASISKFARFFCAM